MATKINLRAPVIFLVIAAIAIPIELTPRGHHSALDLTVDVSHAFVNVLGFVPVGLVLWEFGVFWAVAAAALMSGLAETGQLVMLYRDASVSDFVTNVMGAFLGAVIGARWKIRSPALTVNRWTTSVAAVLALGLVTYVWAENRPVNTHGTASPGTLEAYWKLDETSGRVAVDSSGHRLNGRYSAEPERISSTRGTAAMFDGKKEYVDLGRSTALRLAGSMTITAWINSSSFPDDDAAIVSQLHEGFGYQLDTTVDKGPRTIGFKLSHDMSRYGATPLITGVWYHVAGVYDAPRRTLDVYLNGTLDNGPLFGSVQTTQHSSRRPTYIGRRSDLDGFGFRGSIRDVRIYSLALTKDEVATVMRGESLGATPADRTEGSTASDTNQAQYTTKQNPQNGAVSEPDDQWFPLIVASLGALVAVASIGLWPSAKTLLHSFPSLVAVLLVVPAIAPNVPSFNLWLLPLVAVAAGMSVVLSAHRYTLP